MVRTAKRLPSAAAFGVLVSLVAAAVFVPAAHAEVSAELDPTGRYVRTLVVSHVYVGEVKIWSALPRRGYVPLNPGGDLNNDLWPVIVEDFANGGHPWVVWSRYNGVDYDLAWSRWVSDLGRWSEIDWLQDDYAVGNQVDPDVTIDTESRPYVAWWSDEVGHGQVYFSVWLDTTWMKARLVSDPGVDSRYPTIHPNEDGTITVEFETPHGPESRNLKLREGASINDDADPVGTYKLTRTLTD